MLLSYSTDKNVFMSHCTDNNMLPLSFSTAYNMLPLSYSNDNNMLLLSYNTDNNVLLLSCSTGNNMLLLSYRTDKKRLSLGILTEYQSTKGMNKVSTLHLNDIPHAKPIPGSTQTNSNVTNTNYPAKFTDNANEKL